MYSNSAAAAQVAKWRADAAVGREFLESGGICGGTREMDMLFEATREVAGKHGDTKDTDEGKTERLRTGKWRRDVSGIQTQFGVAPADELVHEPQVAILTAW